MLSVINFLLKILKVHHGGGGTTAAGLRAGVCLIDGALFV